MRAVKRRTLLQAIPAAAMIPASVWAAAQQSGNSSTAVFELRVYHAAAGKLAELEARFRDHTITIFNRHGSEPRGRSGQLESVPGRSRVEKRERKIRGQRKAC